MKHFIIDTNALLSFITDRNPKQQTIMAKIFEKVASAKATILCPQNVIAEFVYVMETVYNQRGPSIRAIIMDFIAMSGVVIVEKTDFPAILTLWPETFTDFGDAIVAACAKANKGSIIITFDKQFMRQLKSCHIEFLTT